jgi:hypothetical protein
MKRYLIFVLMALALAQTACTTTLTNMTTAKALEPGQIQATGGGYGTATTNVVGRTFDAGRQAYDDIRDTPEADSVTVETFRTYIEAALAWLLFQPGFTFEAQFRVGVTDAVLEGVDFGLRYDGNVIKPDVKLQLWESTDEAWAIATSFGYGYHTSIVSSLVEWVTLTDIGRHDFDLQAIVSYHYGDWFRGYVAPRLMHSLVTTSDKLPDFLASRVPEEIENQSPSQYIEGTGAWYVGSSIGTQLGYKYVFLSLELGVYRLLFEPTVLDQKSDFGGMVFTPAGGLTVVW